MISIIISGRNDDYFEDFKERLELCLTLNQRNLKKYNIEYEIIFVEWNPVKDKPYLSDLLKYKFSSVRYIVVDPLVHRYISENRYISFYEFFAKNVGARHARGDFILFTNAEVILGRSLFEFWAKEKFNANILYRADRIDLIKESKEILWEAEDCFNVLEDSQYYKIVHDAGNCPYTNGSGDFTLCHKDVIKVVGGYDESLRFATTGQDSRLVCKIHPEYATAELVGVVYHIDHIRQLQSIRRSYWSPLGPPYNTYGDNNYACSEYGFSNITIEEQRDGYIFLRINKDLEEIAINKIIPEPVIPEIFKL